jgi:hypothetical protein
MPSPGNQPTIGLLSLSTSRLSLPASRFSLPASSATNRLALFRRQPNIDPPCQIDKRRAVSPGQPAMPARQTIREIPVKTNLKGPRKECLAENNLAIKLGPAP